MPGLLLHSPAEIARKVLIALGVGVEPSYAGNRYSGQPWPIFFSGEPNNPDSCITVYDTTGNAGQRTMIDGQFNDFDGIQVRIRAASHGVGFVKAKAVKTAMEEQAYEEAVTIGDADYVLHSFDRVGQVLSLGKESPESTRRLFTVNAVASVRMLEEV